ncbi:MAG TPA: plastocyanin/azurin family copper-binding protein [Candidatus Baltobacteraceae bacterium]|nr:plastocyanin/azurin family copper-binding protein [Candidatus Baltobacteraceae bacterium]
MKQLGLICVLALAACGGAGTAGDPPADPPQTWNVNAGGSEMSAAIQALDFYPNTITIHSGDTITWSNSTTIPHTVSIPQAGATPPPGPPNPAPVGGNVFDNSAYISSGFITNGTTYTVRFTRPGSYPYFCIVHMPEMAGTVVVLPGGAALPMSPAQYAAEGSADLATDLQAGVASIQLFPYTPGGTHIAAGIAPGLPGAKPTQATVMRYLDDATLSSSNITVAVGTTITWTNESNNAPHTVTFPVAGQQPPSGPPEKVPPSGGSTYDGTTLTNSGVMPPGGSYSLTFTKAGTYTYYCLFHDGPTGMIGTVTVQ